GTAGMAPTLSLSYNSNGGNGLLGMGWGIDGLSQISRCPKTIIQDGAMGGVNYTTADKICIDGQRLISTGGVYGANATEYRTESANFAKIISYTTTVANGPDSFKVWTKAGQVIEYGNTADSRIEAAAKTVIRSWGVNKISDTKGNYITVSYIEDNPNGEAYVSRVDYTGNATSSPVLTPYASVQFVYEARPDTTTSYHAGSVIKQTKRMTNIKTYNGATLVKDYRMTYANTGAYSVDTSNVKNGSLITQVKECDGSATPTCLNPMTFNWQAGTVNAATFAAAQAWSGLPAGATVIDSADINGDGRSDVLYDSIQGSFPTTHILKVAFSNGIGFTGDVNTGLQGGTNTCLVAGGMGGGCTTSVFTLPAVALGDVNGDGKADLVTSSGVYFSTGNAFSAVQSSPTGSIIALADINGDGRSDVLYDSIQGSFLTTHALNVAFSNGNGFTGAVNTGLQGGTNTCVAGGGMGGCTTSVFTLPAVALGDVNGDGKADLVTSSGVYFSTGNAFSAVQSSPTGSIIALADINGDGRSDVLYDSIQGSFLTTHALNVAFSNGNGFTGAVNTGLQGGTNTCVAGGGMGGCTTSVFTLPAVALGDVNGDSLSDIVSNTKVSIANQSLPDLLLSQTDGLGNTTNLTQVPLSTAGVYLADTGSAYPVRDVAATLPMYVVSTATVSDGNGGTLTNNYSYGGAKVHLTGRGSLGFRYQKVTNVQADTNSTTFFRQDYPYIGLPSQTEKRITSTNTLVGASALTYANTVLTAGAASSQFPYLSQSVEQNFELGGSLINTTTTTNQYDDFGNATQISVNSNDGYIKTTNNTYLNNPANFSVINSTNWLLGRLLRSTVTSTTP
ncbi:MAG: SpvB/TcaC N-terminal domain-containing protein, partial [Methylococcales bacterium]